MKIEFPNYINFYCVIFSPTKTELKELLQKNGWKIRNESWNDFECTNEWSEMNLLGDESNPLLNGKIINPEENYKKIISLFETFNVRFQSELYNENGKVLFEATHK